MNKNTENTELIKGDKVKIDFSQLETEDSTKDNYIGADEMKNIIKFDSEHKGIHIISQIYQKGLYTGKIVNRIELDGEFVLYEGELIKVGKKICKINNVECSECVPVCMSWKIEDKG